MKHEPNIVERKAQSYAGIGEKVAMDKIAALADRLSREFFSWLGQHRIEPIGAPFFKYNIFGDNGQIDIEWGAPVREGAQGDGRVQMGILPAGRYASVIHQGPYGGLRDGTAALFEWMAKNGHEPDSARTANGEAFACRLEIYLTDPGQELDAGKWQTEIAIKLKDAHRQNQRR